MRVKSQGWAAALAVALLAGLSALAAPEPDKKDRPAAQAENAGRDLERLDTNRDGASTSKSSEYVKEVRLKRAAGGRGRCWTSSTGRTAPATGSTCICRQGRRPAAAGDLDSRRRLGGGQQGRPARAWAAEQGLRRGLPQLSAQSGGQVPRPDRGLQGGRFASCGPTPRSTTSTPTTSASGAPRPAAISSPCSARPAPSRSWKATAPTRTFPAPSRPWSIGSAPRTCRR